MNTCDNGAQPIGEFSELAAIRQAGVVLSPADQHAAVVQLAERQAGKLDAVRALHYAIPVGTRTMCFECGRCDYPCPTIRALDEAGAPRPDRKSDALNEIRDVLVNNSYSTVSRRIRDILVRHGLGEATTC